MDGEEPLLEGMAGAPKYGMTLDHYISRMITTPASAAATSGEGNYIATKANKSSGC